MAEVAEGSIGNGAVRRDLSSAKRGWALTALTVTFMFNFLDRQVMALLVTPIKKDLGLSDTHISLLIGFAFVLFYVAAGIPLSRLIDRGSRKWIVGLGVGFWSLMTMACGFAQNFVQLALARIGLGIGESCNTPATYSLVSDLYPRERLARAIAVINLGNVAGQGMAFFIGGSLILWLTHTDLSGLPLVGGMKPWQLTFLLLGLPGVIWAIVIMATVPEPPRRKEVGGEFDSPGFVDVIRFVVKWRGVYIPLIFGTTIKAMLSFGVSVWSPAFFERQFGWSTGAPGLYLGIISLTVMPVGLMLGGWLADRRTAQGHDDANAYVLVLATVALLPFSILFPLMPTATLALVMQGGALFFGAMGTSPANAAIQLVTPGRMRGTLTALYIAVMNIIGYGAGPLLVALMTDHIFHDEAMLPQSMAISAAVLSPLGVWLCWKALKAYPIAAKLARERQG